MNIAILSGKGGTGKTTVSTNLAVTMGVSYVDCDVEEPNGFLFLNPKLYYGEEVSVGVPVINQDTCVLCGACVKACQFHALSKIGKELLVFEKLCHDCGTCSIVCRAGAIRYRLRTTGKLEYGTAKGIDCRRGVLKVGEPMAVMVIRKLLEQLSEEDHFLDCPPGTSCNVVNTLNYADAVILVTEPSVFGLHDLIMAMELVKLYGIPYGVIINKDDLQENRVKEFLREENVPLFGTIPYGRKAAALYSKGIMLCEEEEFKGLFLGLAKVIKEAFQW